MGNLQLEGRTALVTGAGRGLGRAIALELSAAGTRVIALARSAEALESLADEAPGPVETLPADLGDQAALSELCRWLLERGGATILINNAAVVEPLGQTWATDPGEVRRAYEINVHAPAFIAAAVVPGMLATGWGRIVNVSSGIVAAPAGMVGGNTYAATKAALEAHTVNLAADLTATGATEVTANVYRPGVVDTSMQQWIRTQDPSRIGQRLHERFVAYHADEALMTPAASAAGLMRHLAQPVPATGRIWQVSDQPA